jgi:hypothetical protein
MQNSCFNLEKESADNRRSINKTDKRADNRRKRTIKAIAAERKAANKSV